MATTTNYGWATPDDTDLVKDGAAAIRTLGTSIDTSFAADEGDLLVGGTNDIFEALAIGAAGTVLTSDGDTAEWATPTSASGPAFAAWRSGNQSVAGSTFTKIQINTEEFDTDSCYDPTTNFRFTPDKAGIYQVNFTLKDTGGDVIAAIYKNGSEFKRLWEGNLSGFGNTGGVLMSFNGTTDYVEFYYLHYSGTADITGGQSRTFASATWIRSN
jgi:hypothetical protein